MNKTLFASVILAAVVPAVAQSASQSSSKTSAAGVTVTTAEFVSKASMSDMFEIASSKVAIDRGDNATKEFAQQMVNAHEKTSSELKSIISKEKTKAKPAKSMSPDQQKSLDSLSKLYSGEFKKQYRTEQVKAHEDAVDLFTRYAASGDDRKLKAWAAKTLPALQHHLQMAQNLSDQ